MAGTLERKLDQREKSVVDNHEDRGNAERNSRPDDDCEFSFICDEALSPVSAGDLFSDGQIRPIFPWFGTAAVPELLDLSEEAMRTVKIPAKQLFIEKSDSPSETTSLPKAPAACRKSYSTATGLSKLWRLRDLTCRSQSDGKDAFVFLTTEKREERRKTTSSSSDEVKTTPSPSYYRDLKQRKNGEKRRSYLPYRRDLVGFFTSANSMSRNLHPY